MKIITKTTGRRVAEPELEQMVTDASIVSARRLMKLLDRGDFTIEEVRATRQPIREAEGIAAAVKHERRRRKRDEQYAELMRSNSRSTEPTPVEDADAPQEG